MKIFKKVLKSIIFGIFAMALVAIGIDAADNYDNISESVLGRIIFGESDGPCPKNMVLVPTEDGGFCIDIFEVSPGDDCEKLEVQNQIDTKANLDDMDCMPESKSGAEPWRFISQHQAILACAKAGKRLPTSEEWYLASLGTPDLSSNWSERDCQVSNNWNQQPGLTGSGEICQSSYGAYDMIGNVWEWVKGELEDGLLDGKKMPESGYIVSVNSEGMPIEVDLSKGDENFNNDYMWIKDSGIRGVARGGYWNNKADAGMYSIYLVAPPNSAETGIGFRCAK